MEGTPNLPGNCREVNNSPSQSLDENGKESAEELQLGHNLKC